MIGFVETNALAGNYTDPDTEEIIVVEGEEQWKGIQWTLDLRKILGVTKIFLKSRFFLISNTRKPLKKA